MSRETDIHAIRIFKDHMKAIALYMDDASVQEIMINRPDDVWVEQNGKIFRAGDLNISDVNIRGAIKALAGANNKGMSPVLDCRMTGLRIAAALHPVSINGHALCIRKHARSRRRLTDYLEQGAFDVFAPGSVFSGEDLPFRPLDKDVAEGGEAVIQLLQWIVKTRKNMILAGGTSAGKTSLLNAIIAEIPEEDRVVTIEDTAELQIASPNYVGLEVSEADGVTVRMLIRLSLRFRPDRIIVGEVRGAEAYDLLDAFNTGHSGGACTLHADSAQMALARLENMVRMSPDAANLPLPALRAQIASTFQFVIFASRKYGVRGPEEIIEILGVENGEYRIKKLFNRVREK